MTETQLYTSMDKPSFLEQNDIVEFLFEHLGEYGDPKEYIKKAVDYALSPYPGEGGFVLVEYEGRRVVGAVVVNKTGMSGYIPENILVYIAVHGDMRGKGVGKKLMEKAKEVATGDIALHVEPDNPAVHLYEKTGFTNKYLEMRFSKEGDKKE